MTTFGRARMPAMKLEHSPVVALAEWLMLRVLPMVAPWIILAGLGLIVVCLVTICQR